MPQPKKLIEVAMPVKEISAESVRDKSIRHGHISTLHLWWARRPLPVCRAVVFASLVPDPLDPHCPPAFVEAIPLILGPTSDGTDPYLPYLQIPHAAGTERLEDNARNRLLAFIGKFSELYVANDAKGKTTGAKDMLDRHSLIKWDNKNDEVVIGRARRLIWVAYNAASGKSAPDLVAEYDQAYKAIKAAETSLYQLPDRHQPSEAVATAEAELEAAITAFLERMPKVFDPFAGGGAIPLEAARLGCRSFGNDINPVAHIIQKASLEFPQQFGKPIRYTKAAFVARYGEAALDAIPNEQRVYDKGEFSAVRIPNRLSFDVAFYARKLLAMVEEKVGHLYPADELGRKPIAYYWARVGRCSNPSCGAEVPMLKGFYLVNTKEKKVYLDPQIEGGEIRFAIKSGVCPHQGWMDKSNLTCPVCGGVTSAEMIRDQVAEKKISERMLAVFFSTDNEGKGYREPTKAETEILSQVPFVAPPSEKLPNASRLTGGFIVAWGYREWGEMFTPRQLAFLDCLIAQNQLLGQTLGKSHDPAFANAVRAYLAIWIDRIAVVNTSFGRWHVSGEKLEHPFARQAIPMSFDYPESNPFCNSTGGALNQLEWIVRYIDSEGDNPFASESNHASSGEKTQFPDKWLTAVVTDPPYYDAIAYADLSDFFYVWLKRTLGDVFPLNFSTPQTPKTDECTALKHHHNGKAEVAKQFFEDKLGQIFDAIEHQTSDIVSIMFAHQSTEAWTTLCNSILGARMNITGSWAMDTEMANRSVGLAGAALESSVTVAARPAQRQGIGSYREVKKAIAKTVAEEVELLYRLGFRGADLLTACFGQAVSEFGRYARVEKADGTEVTVAELLEMARESAFDALLKGFEGDDFTRFYIGWLQLYGFALSDFDDAAKFSRVGLSIDVNALFVEHILIKQGNQQVLGSAAARSALVSKLGEATDSPLIDQVQRAMLLFDGTDRVQLLTHIAKLAPVPEHSFWRVLTSLCELLPSDSKDLAQAQGLLANKDSLIRDSKNPLLPAQGRLF